MSDFVDSNWCPDCKEPRNLCQCRNECDNCRGTGYVREGYDGESPCEFCNHDNFVSWLRDQWRQSENEISALKTKNSALTDRAEVAEARLSLTIKNAKNVYKVFENLLEACYQADEAGELYETIDGSLLDAAKDALDTADMIEKQTKQI